MKPGNTQHVTTQSLLRGSVSGGRVGCLPKLLCKALDVLRSLEVSYPVLELVRATIPFGVSQPRPLSLTFD